MLNVLTEQIDKLIDLVK